MFERQNGIPADASKLRKSLPLSAGLILLLLLAYVGYTSSCSSGFSEDDIGAAKSAIRTEFEKQGFTVEEVSLIKESDRRLSGFVRLKKSASSLGEVQVTRDCTATMSADSPTYIWECK